MLVSEPLTGLENVQRGVFLALFDDINPAIDKMQSWYDASDQEFATRTGRPYVLTTIEHIDPANFHEGHKPSLANSAITGFPNISVMALRSNPSNEDAALDQTSSYSNTVFVEILIKSENSEEETNRRIHRTVEAANFCMSNNPTLGGIASGLESVPRTDISEVFVKAERTSYGPEWFWQGARIEYTVRMQASLPPESGILRSSSAPEYAIDQD